jgi:hypothetical protein
MLKEPRNKSKEVPLDPLPYPPSHCLGLIVGRQIDIIVELLLCLSCRKISTHIDSNEWEGGLRSTYE